MIEILHKCVLNDELYLHCSTLISICLSKANWKEELQKYIDADNLPEYYGGTGCNDKDPKCSSKVPEN